MSAERVNFTLNVRQFPELKGESFSTVKAAALEAAKKEDLGTLGTFEHLQAVIAHPRSTAAKLLIPFKAYFFLGDEIQTFEHSGLTYEKAPHIHVMDHQALSFMTRKMTHIWWHTHMLAEGLRDRDWVAFAKSKKRAR